MSGDVAEWGEQPTPKLPPRPGTFPADEPDTTGAPVPVEPQLFFGSVDEFVREKLRYTYARRVGPKGSNRWDAD